MLQKQMLNEIHLHNTDDGGQAMGGELRYLGLWCRR